MPGGQLFSKDASEEAFKEKVDALKTEVKYWEDYAQHGYIAGEEFTMAGALPLLQVPIINFASTMHGCSQV